MKQNNLWFQYTLLSMCLYGDIIIRFVCTDHRYRFRAVEVRYIEYCQDYVLDTFCEVNILDKKKSGQNQQNHIKVVK